MLKKYVFALICLVLTTNVLVGQTENEALKIPQIVPMSPEAGSLGSYGEIGVGEYTGAPDISVLLHVVKSGKIEFPINLYYNATGIKVNQEASWVGLGWDLSAVAGITYIAAGANDQLVATQTIPVEWEKYQTMIDYINPLKDFPTTGYEDGHIGWGCSYILHPPVNTPAQAVTGAAAGQGQWDLYSVNCLGFSFKFYIHPETGKPRIFGDKNNFRIEVVENIGFLITDGNGVMYQFYAREETNNAQRIINNWFLTEIRRPDGDWIKFTHENFGAVKTIPALSEMTLGPETFKRTVHPSMSIKNMYLTKIESSTETVEFYLSDNRIDISGDGRRRLDSISVVDKFSDSKKKFVFEFGYFDADNVGGNYLDDDDWNRDRWLTFGLTEDNLKKRLKLLSVTEKVKESVQNKKHSFEYFEDELLPYKTSFAVDHWGYFNGQSNTSNSMDFNNSFRTIIPRFFSIFYYDPSGKKNVTTEDLYDGANRGASSEFIKAGSLKSITYPTGGKTDFIFEPHSFSNLAVLSAEEESAIDHSEINHTIYDLNYTNGSGDEYTSVEFTLTTETELDFMGHINNKNGSFNYDEMEGTRISLLQVMPAVGPWKSWERSFFPPGENYSETWNEKILLPAGKYVLSCNLTNSLGFQGYNMLVTSTIKYRVPATPGNTTEGYESIGGGLRIKRLDNFDENHSLISSREYNYIKEDGGTSGKLLMPMKYTQLLTIANGKTPPNSFSSCEMQTSTWNVRNSNSSFSLSTSPIKAIIGYERVAITDLDHSNNANNGKIVKTFENQNTLGTFFDEIILSDGMSNGDLLSTSYFDIQGKRIQVDSFSYDVSALEKDWINVIVKDLYNGPTGYCDSHWDSDVCAYIGRYLIGVYPYVNYKKLLSKKIQTKYSDNGNFQTISEYKYNMENFEVNEIRNINSNHEEWLTKMKYPGDFINESSIYGSMLQQNIVSPVVEQSILKDGNQIERIKSNFSLVDNFNIKPVTVEHQLRDYPSEVKITYGRYTNGNISQYLTNDGMYNSVLWGYNKTLPVAVVNNSRLDNIFYTGFEDAEGNSSYNDSKTGRKSRVGGYLKTLEGLSTGKYKLTYWFKEGAEWILKEQDVNITSGSSYTINISASFQLDDIRFYPVDALMTTYTYDPINGMTSQTDHNNIATHYEYDDLHRLQDVKDYEANIVKAFEYHFFKP